MTFKWFPISRRESVLLVFLKVPSVMNNYRRRVCIQEKGQLSTQRSHILDSFICILRKLSTQLLHLLKKSSKLVWMNATKSIVWELEMSDPLKRSDPEVNSSRKSFQLYSESSRRVVVGDHRKGLVMKLRAKNNAAPAPPAARESLNGNDEPRPNANHLISMIGRLGAYYTSSR